MDFSLIKKQMRTKLVHERSAIEADYARNSAEKLVSFVKEMKLPKGAVVSAYWPMKSEMDIRPVMTYLFENGYTVALPVVTAKGQPMIFRRWTPDEALVIGPYGIEEPSEDCDLVIPEFLFLPLLAFDRQGGRLGYGGGFYDRTIVELRKAGKHHIGGVGFACQEVEKVPLEETDEKLDFILTEKELIEVS